MKNYILNIGKGMIFAGAISLASCTGWFDNVPPYEATEDILEGDNVKVGAFFPQLQRNVVSTHNNQFQLSQNLVGDIYSGYMAIPTNFNSNKNNATYFFQDNWLNSPFEKVYTQAIGAYIEIKKSVDGDENSHIYQWAQILKIASMHRFTDMWGPLPYTQVGSGSMTTPYDSQETVYMKFFEELDKAAEVLTKFTVNNPGSKPMAEYDLVYGGDYSKWVKFANSLKLRMAMRISSVSPALAKEKAEEAVSDVIGVMTSASDAAYSKYNDGMNPYYRVTSSWNEIRISANITSYLSGYNDPRLAKYASEADASIGGGQIGVRNGIYQSATTQANYTKFSRLNIGIDDELLIMSASEAYFLRAEAALMYKWNMGGTPKELYDTGVTVSMEERKATIGDYLKSEKVPAAYSDPSDSGKDIAAVSTVTPKYNESASVTENLERILIQKWIANFPNGCETWLTFVVQVILNYSLS